MQIKELTVEQVSYVVTDVAHNVLGDFETERDARDVYNPEIGDSLYRATTTLSVNEDGVILAHSAEPLIDDIGDNFSDLMQQAEEYFG